MSLINDALKKAQRQRSVDNAAPILAAPSSLPAPSARMVKRAKLFHFDSQVLRLALTVLGVGLLLVGGVLYYQWKNLPAHTLSLKDNKLATGTTPKATPSEPEKQKSLAPSATPLSKNTLPIGSKTTTLVSEAPTTTPVAAKTTVPAITIPLPANKLRPEPKILAFIDALRITGIRAAGADSKVLMNDRVYRVNDIVEHLLGVRLTGVEANALLFEDERGVAYRKNF